MRIAVNTRMLLKNRLEGIGRFTYETVRRIVVDHPEDEFIFFFDRPYDDSFVFADNVIPVVLYPPARHPILHYLWFEWAITAALKKHKADLFFSPDGYLSLQAKIPTLLVTHDLAYIHYPEHIPWLVRKYYSYFIPKFHKRAEHIVSVSSATKEDLMQQFSIHSSKISLAYNGCTDRFRPISEFRKMEIREIYSRGKPYFIYVGSIHPRKNIANLIRAFEEYCGDGDNEMQLLLVGRWAWKTDEIKTVYNQSKVKHRIVLLEHIQDELPDILAAAKAMIYVSLFEGFGIPVLEAMYCDVPVITSNISSMPEVAGDAALLVNPKDSKTIADAMTRITENDSLTQELVEKGRDQRKKFSWQKSADDIYSELMKIKG